MSCPTITAPISSSSTRSSQSASVHATAWNTPGSTRICMSFSSSTIPRPPTTNALPVNFLVFKYAAAANAALNTSPFSTWMPICSNLCTYCARDLLLLFVTNTSLLPCCRNSSMDSLAPGSNVSPCQITPSQSSTTQSTSMEMRASKPSPSSRRSASAFSGSERVRVLWDAPARPPKTETRGMHWIPNRVFPADFAETQTRGARPERTGAVGTTHAAIVPVGGERTRVR
mmetsp:Transcript_9126/g.34119  ORF Transcript_9126/g.34119 Transcript_9126/m.34119 type:complete len:229 (+) Transcript_9126:831-1517(+)